MSALGLACGALVSLAGPAHAVLPPGKVVVAAAGSDTSEKLMTQIMANQNNKSVTIDGNPETSATYNIPALPATGFTVPGETSAAVNCAADVTWNADPGAPGSTNTNPPKGTAPFGSTAGRNYLFGESGIATDAGCIDVARSSSAPRSVSAATNPDAASFKYFAYAMDAVGWATTSLKAPSTLTRQQITDIYDCVTTDWGSLPGGQSGPIMRYFPQAGSGTRSFFTSDILVGKSGSYVPPSAGTGGCTTDPVFIEENEGQQIAAADIDKAILPYSAALWSLHAQNAINPTIDRRNGARMGGITTTAPTPLKSSAVTWVGDDNNYEINSGVGGVVVETNIKQFNPSFAGGANNGEFPGIRYIYNVLDSAGNLPGYQAGLQLLGFTNVASGAKSPTCDAKPGGTGQPIFGMILSNGFAPLPATANATNNVAGSTCRFFGPNP